MASATPDAGPDGRPFDSLQGHLNQYLLQALKAMKFTTMSPVQERVLTELPSYTSDCLVQAKTGTGKTCAFLLPILHTLLTSDLPINNQVRALIITPTRELALQIKKECDQLTSQLPKPVECHTAFGGTARASTLQKFMSGHPSILVSTPGRLKDYLSEALVAARFEGIRTVVLDEADTMLEAGFLGDVRQILRLIPPKTASTPWQGMCFSATVPDRIKDVIQCVLGKNYVSLSTVSKTEPLTIEKVPQFSVLYPDHTKMFTVMYSLLERICTADSKIIVFGITANLVALYANVFSKLLNQVQVFELHSRLSQNVRTRTTEQFKAARTGIIFASDVIGRGMDFPNVDMVLQVGMPTSGEQYIHRVGRTGRAGKGGSAIIMLTQAESSFLSSVRHLPISPYPDTQAVNSISRDHVSRLETVMGGVDATVKQRAYSAFIGFFAGSGFLRQLRLDKAGLVSMANDWAIDGLLCDVPPPMEAKTIGKMGLKGVPGFNVGANGAKRGAQTPNPHGPSKKGRNFEPLQPELEARGDFGGQFGGQSLRRGRGQSNNQPRGPPTGDSHGMFNGDASFIPPGMSHGKGHGSIRGNSSRGRGSQRRARGGNSRGGGRGGGGGGRNGDAANGGWSNGNGSTNAWEQQTSADAW